MFNFVEVTNDIYRDTAHAWHEQLLAMLEQDVSIYPTTYLMKLDWAKKHAAGKGDKNSYLYALTRDAQPTVACAFLDVTYALPNSAAAWLKVLSIQVEPQLDAVLDPPAKVLAEVAATALIKAVGLTFDHHPCQKLKVYGTTPLTLDFMEAVAATLDSEELQGLTIAKHGNWLVIER